MDRLNDTLPPQRGLTLRIANSQFGGEKRTRDPIKRYKWVDLSSLPHQFLWDWDSPWYPNRLPPSRGRMVCDRGGCPSMRNPRGIPWSGRLYPSFPARIGTRRSERSQRGQSLQRSSSKWWRPLPRQAQRLFDFSFSCNLISFFLMGRWKSTSSCAEFFLFDCYSVLDIVDVFLFEKEWNVTNNQAVL